MRTTRLRDTLLGVAMAALAMSVAAAPTFNGAPYAFTENYGPNTAGFGVGLFFHLGVSVDDPGGVPANIASVVAVQGSDPSISLPFLDIGSIHTGLYEIIDPYAGELGSWTITATNNQAESVSATTSELDKVRVVPLATSLLATGSSLAPVITWDPVSFDDDLNATTPDVEVNAYRVRLLDSVNEQFFRSGIITGNSFNVPAGLIVPGLTVIRLEAQHWDFENTGDLIENRSSTFTMFVAVPEPVTLGMLIARLTALRRRRRSA